MTGVTNMLGQIEAGDPSTAGKLLPLVHEELKKHAGQRLEPEIIRDIRLRSLLNLGGLPPE